MFRLLDTRSCTDNDDETDNILVYTQDEFLSNPQGSDAQFQVPGIQQAMVSEKEPPISKENHEEPEENGNDSSQKSQTTPKTFWARLAPDFCELSKKDNYRIWVTNKIVVRCALDLSRSHEGSFLIGDVGCGNGQLSDLVRSDLKDILGRIGISKVVTTLCIDCKAMVEIAKSTCETPSVAFQEGSASRLSDVRDGQVHFAIYSFVLHDLENLPEAVRQMNRILALNGEAIIIIPHPAFPMAYRTREKGTDSYIWAQNYLTEHVQLVDKLLGKQLNPPLPVFSRPISKYLQEFMKAGLTPVEVIEPFLCNAAKRDIPQEALDDIDTKTPISIFFRLKKSISPHSSKENSVIRPPSVRNNIETSILFNPVPPVEPRLGRMFRSIPPPTLPNSFTELIVNTHTLAALVLNIFAPGDSNGIFHYQNLVSQHIDDEIRTAIQTRLEQCKIKNQAPKINPIEPNYAILKAHFKGLNDYSNRVAVVVPHPCFPQAFQKAMDLNHYVWTEYYSIPQVQEFRPTGLTLLHYPLSDYFNAIFNANLRLVEMREVLFSLQGPDTAAQIFAVFILEKGSTIHPSFSPNPQETENTSDRTPDSLSQRSSFHPNALLEPPRAPGYSSFTGEMTKWSPNSQLPNGSFGRATRMSAETSPHKL